MVFRLDSFAVPATVIVHMRAQERHNGGLVSLEEAREHVGVNGVEEFAGKDHASTELRGGVLTLNGNDGVIHIAIVRSVLGKGMVICASVSGSEWVEKPMGGEKLRLGAEESLNSRRACLVRSNMKNDSEHVNSVAGESEGYCTPLRKSEP